MAHRDLDEIPWLRRWRDLIGTLKIHDLDVVVTHVRFEVGREFRTVGLIH